MNCQLAEEKVKINFVWESVGKKKYTCVKKKKEKSAARANGPTQATTSLFLLFAGNACELKARKSLDFKTSEFPIFRPRHWNNACMSTCNLFFFSLSSLA